MDFVKKKHCLFWTLSVLAFLLCRLARLLFVQNARGKLLHAHQLFLLHNSAVSQRRFFLIFPPQHCFFGDNHAWIFLNVASINISWHSHFSHEVWNHLFLVHLFQSLFDIHFWDWQFCSHESRSQTKVFLMLLHQSMFFDIHIFPHKSWIHLLNFCLFSISQWDLFVNVAILPTQGHNTSPITCVLQRSRFQHHSEVDLMFNILFVSVVLAADVKNFWYVTFLRACPRKNWLQQGMFQLPWGCTPLTAKNHPRHKISFHMRNGLKSTMQKPLSHHLSWCNNFDCCSLVV